MAISGRLLTLQGLQELASEGKGINLSGIGLELQQDNLIEKVKDKLLDLYADALANEQNILKLFNVSDLKALEEKFQTFLEATQLEKFTGPSLRSAVLNSYKIAYKAKDADFEYWVQHTFLERLKNKVSATINTHEFEVEISKALVKELSGDFSNGKIRNIGDKITSGRLYNNKLGEILINELTENRRERLEQLYKEDTGKTTSESGTIKFENEPVHGNEIVRVIGKFNYYRATQDILKGKSKKDITDEDRKELIERLSTEMQNVLSYGQQYLPKNVLVNILGQHKEDLDSFFIGGNINDITGILWEFTVAAALQKLIPSANLAAIQWAAKQTVDNKQLSTDFIVKFIDGINIGIQVKNTTKDLEKLQKGEFHKLEFVDANINLVFEKLGSKYPVFNQFSQTIKDLYASADFNVAYDWKEKEGKLTYFEAAGSTRPGAAEYQTVKSELLDLKGKFDTFIKIFSPDLIFASTGPSFENSLAVLSEEAAKAVSGNNIYIIGKHVLFVSTILLSIIQDLDKIEVSIKRKKIKPEDMGKEEFTRSVGTIVEYKNSYVSAKSRKNRKALVDTFKNQNYQFTSAYLYG